MSAYFISSSKPSPALHALVIGVGDYEHLGLNAVKPSTFLNGLQPLTTTPLSAKRIATWLETAYVNAACPLGSIELLLSPGEAIMRNGTAVAVEAATTANITAAVDRWYRRCHEHKDNIAFFYFAGHGISTISQFLLSADFGNPDMLDEWENCIDFTKFQIGMTKCQAQTQLFFVDACRDTPIGALIQRNPHGKSLVGSSIHDKVYLSAAYFAASEGRQAYGRDGDETFFCKALVTCLDGVGARKPGAAWRVDAASLSNGLVAVMDFLASAEGLPLSCECTVQKPVALHYPKMGSVMVKVDCDPIAASIESVIVVTQNNNIVHQSLTGQRRPWVGCVDAGKATVEVTFINFLPETVNDDMMPPTYSVEVDR